MCGEGSIYLIDNTLCEQQLLEDVLRDAAGAVHTFNSGHQFLDQTILADVGCVIVSLGLPAIQALDIQKELFWRDSTLSVIGISTDADTAMSVEMIRHGAIAILERPINTEHLLSVVSEGMKKSLRSQVARARMNEFRLRLCQLTDSENEVMKCLMNGLSRKAIASLLDLSPRSVDRRRKTVLEKLKVSTLQELISKLAELQLDGQSLRV